MVGRRRKRQAGFTLVELMLVVAILGILAALVIPHFSNASDAAKGSGLREDLRNLRTQMMLYRAQHRDVSPGYPDGDTAATPALDVMTAQLTLFSNDKGQTAAVRDAAHPFGPYMTRLPTNPINDSSAVRFVAAGATFPTAAAGTEGWVYQPSTGAISANVTGTDGDGVNFFDY